MRFVVVVFGSPVSEMEICFRVCAWVSAWEKVDIKALKVVSGLLLAARLIWRHDVKDFSRVCDKSGTVVKSKSQFLSSRRLACLERHNTFWKSLCDILKFSRVIMSVTFLEAIISSLRYLLMLVLDEGIVYPPK
ncbi:unnamed protein product [Moneuplotes crassus]|uniref:Uncharacterized protein n=1 Tax=Euplotes crassus TaxID=5936 RepID=A0AAD1XLB8_EUPCR|nr:unnamed protein product [Moneuplotes crassus]